MAAEPGARAMSASEIADPGDPISRRQFARLMSASFLMAGFGLTGCRRPEEEILPYASTPENQVHGVPQFYATAMPVRGSAIPLVVKSHEGRPIKIEGNALHPDSNGATDHFAQASILDLYDPDRTARFLRRGVPVSRAVALDTLREIALSFGDAYQGLGAGDPSSSAAGKVGGLGLCFLQEQSSSPSRSRLQRILRERLPRARWFVHEPVDFAIHRLAASAAFDRPVEPYFRLDAASVIVALDCDFLGAEPDACRHIAQFAQGRRLAQPGQAPSRLYAAEALFTLTGANADHRLRVPASGVPGMAARLADAVFALTGGGDPAGRRALGRFPVPALPAGWIEACARDLAARRGESIVMAGHRQPLAVHLLAHAMNAALGNLGRTIRLHPAEERREGSLADLARALHAGEVDTLVILGGNPAYTAPADLSWPQTQRLAKTVVRLGYHEDETTAASDLHLPLAHYLESWGDARTADGTLVPIQPLIAPLFDGLTELEVLAQIGGLEPARPYDLVRATFREVAGNADDTWKRFLQDGFLANSAAVPVEAAFNWHALAAALDAAPAWDLPAAGSPEVIFHRDAKLDDGRYANNGWLQELPDPITKLTWDNVIQLSRATAEALGWGKMDLDADPPQAPIVTLQVDGRTLAGPAWIQPGLADGVLALALGYGRRAAGRVGANCGYDAYAVRTTAAPWLVRGGQTHVAFTGRTRALAVTQVHGSMEDRPIIREATWADYVADPEFARGLDRARPPAGQPLYPNPLDVPDARGSTPRRRAFHQWGMVIDLNACVGCAACVVACQGENNVPIVGPDQVTRHREMHWLRLDRYYLGDPAEPRLAQQPMLCQHCENAPCEYVCPVNATVHDDEGLNLMVYNRCIGARFCSNNCPYKVRRFNFLDYHRRPRESLQGPFYPSPITHTTDGEWDLKRWWNHPEAGYLPARESKLSKLAQNPDVTVRLRGVMEKCTFCLQRIAQAKIAQKLNGGARGDVTVPTDTIQTACQQACPAEAIAFGNLKDPHSRVSQLKQQGRNYAVLEFLDTQPRLTYLARVRNPNPALPDPPVPGRPTARTPARAARVPAPPAAPAAEGAS